MALGLPAAPAHPRANLSPFSRLLTGLSSVISGQVSVGSAAELLELVAKGNRVRTTQATETNDTSSRSHAICRVRRRRAPCRFLEAAPTSRLYSL